MDGWWARQPSVFGANMADMTPIRAADSRFVLDQLTPLGQVEPASPLVGHLDVRHTGIVGPGSL